MPQFYKSPSVAKKLFQTRRAFRFDVALTLLETNELPDDALVSYAEAAVHTCRCPTRTWCLL